MKWFHHDSNAHADAKLRKLMLRYGLEGYGLYFYCLELIAGDLEAHNFTFELEHDSEIIAHDVGLHQERIEEMMTWMVSAGLFENQNGTITCYKMAKRIDSSMTSNPKLRQLIQEHKSKNHDGVMTGSCLGHDGVMQEEKRREEKRYGGKTLRFVPPTHQEVADYCREKGYSIDIDHFINHYEMKGWMVGKSKMKNWRSAVANATKWDSNQKEDSRGSGQYGVGGI